MSVSGDERVGRLLYRLRRQSGTTQEQLASLAHISVEDIHAIESGLVGRVRVDRARRAFAALGGRLYLRPWWHGADADRLLDEEHAAIVEAASAVFSRRGWRTVVELTFSEFGERGSIDLFAGFDLALAVAVCEIKSAFGSLEETNRSLDAKVRLAPILAERAFGWRPKHVGRFLILPDAASIRRVVNAHSRSMNSTYPERGRATRAWLRKPDRSFAAIWFLSIPAIRRP